MSEREEWNRKVIEEFRANSGKVGGQFENIPLLLLHHTGAKSGSVRISPLAHRRVGDNLVVFASNGGRPNHPVPGFADYEAATTRQIPVVVLEPAP